MPWWTEAEIIAFAPINLVGDIPSAEKDAAIAEVQSFTEEEVTGYIPPGYTMTDPPPNILITCAKKLGVFYLVGKFEHCTDKERDYAAQLADQAYRTLRAIAEGKMASGLTAGASQTRVVNNNASIPTRHSLGTDSEPGLDDDFVIGGDR